MSLGGTGRGDRARRGSLKRATHPLRAVAGRLGSHQVKPNRIRDHELMRGRIARGFYYWWPSQSVNARCPCPTSLRFRYDARA
jgi:hypothetical protein